MQDMFALREGQNIEENYFLDEVQIADIFFTSLLLQAKAYLADPSAFAAAAPAAAAAEEAAPAAAAAKEVEEEKEESDDDMGFGLFD